MNQDTPVNVWTARFMRRLGYEGRTDGQPWRILPQSETSPSNLDTAFSQLVFETAAKKMGADPNKLQLEAAQSEAQHWQERGWNPLTVGSKGGSGPAVQGQQIAQEEATGK
jgi:hypothetical protein